MRFSIFGFQFTMNLWILLLNLFSRFFLLLISLLTLSSFLNPCLAQKKYNVKYSGQIIGDDGVVLKIDLEYAVNKKKELVDNRYVEYTVTNVGSVIYNGTLTNKKNALVFDLSTKDGKLIEKSVSFLEVLSPGKSTFIKYFIPDVGPKATCVSVKPSRLDFWGN